MTGFVAGWASVHNRRQAQVTTQRTRRSIRDGIDAHKAYTSCIPPTTRVKRSPQVTGSETTTTTTATTAPSATTTVDGQQTADAHRPTAASAVPHTRWTRAFREIIVMCAVRWTRARGQTPHASCTRTRPAYTHRRVHAYAHVLATAQLRCTAVEKGNLRLILCLERLIMK